MNLLERVLTLLRANLNSVVEKANDPEKVLRQLQLDMHNQLVQVKTQVATAIAEGHRLQKRSQEHKAEADTWLKKAGLAVQQGNDDAARKALTHYNDLNNQVKRYQQQKKEQDQLVVTMRNALRQLEAKITEVDTTIDLLATRKRNALLQQRAFESKNVKEKERASKAQDAVLEAEARARALVHLHKLDLDAQMDQLSAEQVVEQQLEAMKASKQIPPEPPRLHDSQSQTADLIAPQPESQAPARRRRQERPPQTQPLADDPSTSRDMDVARIKKLLDLPQNTD